MRVQNNVMMKQTQTPKHLSYCELGCLLNAVDLMIVRSSRGKDSGLIQDLSLLADSQSGDLSVL